MAGRSIENLYIWNESRLFVNKIYSLFASNKDWGFRDQIQRAAVSVMNNIAEGAESGSDATFARYLSIARGSCSEVKSMLYLGEDLGYVSSDKRIELHNQLYKISTGIINLKGSLDNKANETDKQKS